MLLSFRKTFVIDPAETAGLHEFPGRISLRTILTFIKVIQVVRFDSMVTVKLTDTDYWHALIRD